jgi:hypothetical protein
MQASTTVQSPMVALQQYGQRHRTIRLEKKNCDSFSQQVEATEYFSMQSDFEKMNNFIWP